MNFHDVVFLSLHPLSERDCKRLGFEALEKAGLRPVYIEVGDILTPSDEPHAQPSTSSYPHHYRASSTAELVSIVAGLDRPIVSDTSVGPAFPGLQQVLSRTGAGYMAVRLSVLPEDHSQEKPASLYERLWWVSRDPARLLRKFIPSRSPRMPSPDLLVAGGLKARDAFPPLRQDTRVAWTHALDYDTYLETIAQPALLPGERFGLFMDQFLPLHPDYALEGRPSQLPAEPYYRQLNDFMSALEDKFGIPMVIAAHPHGRYEDYPDFFPGRRMIKGNTGVLARDAEFSVATHSMSLGFAVLYNRPIVLITTDAVCQTRDFHFHTALCKALGLPSVNIDHQMDVELTYDNPCYLDYIAQYIKTPDSQNRPFWDIVADELTR